MDTVNCPQAPERYLQAPICEGHSLSAVYELFSASILQMMMMMMMMMVMTVMVTMMDDDDDDGNDSDGDDDG